VSHSPRTADLSRGFTLIEVLVALVIVAFGVGAVLAALSAAAVNVNALREKTLAQWIALNRIADVRLNLQAPQTGTTEGDVKNFANGDWHWQQIITAMDQIPGLMQITVKVRRIPAKAGSSSSSNNSKMITYSSTASLSSSTSSSSSKDNGDWITTVIGFRGDALQAATGESVTWSGTDFTGSSSSSGAGVTTGTVPNPGTTTNAPGTPTPVTPTPGTPTAPGSSSSSGP
jgi:general secretion pathway protein I